MIFEKFIYAYLGKTSHVEACSESKKAFIVDKRRYINLSIDFIKYNKLNLKHILSKQVLRNYTFIVASINKAQEGQCFVDLLIVLEYLNVNRFYVKNLKVDIGELIKLITSIFKVQRLTNA